MARFDSLRNVATRLIARNGRLVTLRKIVDTAPANANRPWEPSGQTFTDFTVRSVIIPFNITEVDGTLILAQDKQAYISAQDIGDVDIIPKDEIIDGARTYRIVNVTDLSPNEEKVLYTLQLRG